MPSKYKTYTRSSSNESYRVKTWGNKICHICKQFITTKLPKQKLCNKCYKKIHAIQSEVNHDECRNPVLYYGMQTIRELIDFPLSQELSSNLRNYV